MRRQWLKKTSLFLIVQYVKKLLIITTFIMELTVASHVEPFSGESIKRQKPRNTSVRNLELVMCLSKIEKVVKDAGMIFKIEIWFDFSAHFKKSTQNFSFEFSFLAFSTGFFLLKLTCLVTQKLATIDYFWYFYELLSTQNVNVARFALNVECDFLCDF